MYKLLTNKRDAAMENEEGFTLIELMVVVLIIGILMAIAIPTFLSAKNGANQKAAQENVRNAVTTEASFFSNSQAYDVSVVDLGKQEPNLAFAAGGTSGATPANTATNTVYVSQANSAASVLLTALSKDGNCYSVAIISGTTYYSTVAAASGACPAPSSYTANWTTTTPVSPQPAAQSWATANA